MLFRTTLKKKMKLKALIGPIYPTNLVIVFNEHSQLLFDSVNTTPYHLAWFQPSSPSAKEPNYWFIHRGMAVDELANEIIVGANLYLSWYNFVKFYLT